MTLTFVTNFVHHHQIPLADEFYKLLGENYHYVATKPLPDSFVKGGYDASIERPYIIRSYDSAAEMKVARELIDESDVVIHGAAPAEWSLERQNGNKVTFFYSERWLKRINIHTLSPRRLLGIYKNYYRFRNNRSYMLCASAYTAKDVHVFGCFPNKCFKWGYFTAIDYNAHNTACRLKMGDKVRIMWCARFVKLKHPEMPVMLAKRLKDKGYNFVIDMFGAGEEYSNIQVLIDKLKVADCVHLCGTRPNSEILDEMKNHAIFLFTSNRIEGWGAVINEAMSSGCVPVMSDVIGSGPYLIDEGQNGFRYQYGKIDSLESKVCSMLDNPEKIALLSQNAQNTLRNVWSPQNAAKSFMELASHAMNNCMDSYSVLSGPASRDNS